MSLRRSHRLLTLLMAAVALSTIALPAANRARHPVKKTDKTEKPDAKEVPAAATGHVSDIRYWSLADTTRVAVEISSEYKLKVDRLRNPDRIFFDIIGAKPQGDLKGIQIIRVGDHFLKQIRIAETQPGTTRIVLDLEAQADYSASQLTSPDRLMIEIRPPGSAKKTGVQKPETVAAVASRPTVVDGSAPVRLDPPPRVEPLAPKIPATAEVAMLTSPPPAASVSKEPPKESLPAIDTTTSPRIPGRPALAPPSPAKRYTSGDTSLTRALGLKFGRIVIDAGHGGHDTGTSGASGLLEKDLVLDVAKRLAALVETRMQSEVVMTRSDDTFIPLERRPQLANEAKADLFISIHANSSSVKTVSGVEVYYLNFTTNRAALDVAARENASSGHSLFDLKDLLQQIALREKLDESREFAAKVQASLVAQSVKNNVASRDRGVKKAPFIVLIGASMPSILAEIGFVTNPKDEGMMKRPENRQKIAEALYRGLAQYASGLSHFQVAQHKTSSE